MIATELRQSFPASATTTLRLVAHGLNSPNLVTSLKSSTRIAW